VAVRERERETTLRKLFIFPLCASRCRLNELPPRSLPIFILLFPLIFCIDIHILRREEGEGEGENKSKKKRHFHSAAVSNIFFLSFCHFTASKKNVFHFILCSLARCVSFPSRCQEKRRTTVRDSCGKKKSIKLMARSSSFSLLSSAQNQIFLR
jgi:hypothetical protein